MRTRKALTKETAVGSKGTSRERWEMGCCGWATGGVFVGRGWKGGGKREGREEGRVLTGLRVVESARVGDGCGWKMEEGRKEGRKWLCGEGR